MKLFINTKYGIEFAYNYIPKVIKRQFDISCNKARIKQLTQDLGLDVLGIINLSITTLTKNQVNDSYVLSINKNIKIEDQSLESLINKITYGTRDTKGYPILLDIFKYITENIDLFYERWLDGC